MGVAGRRSRTSSKYSRYSSMKSSNCASACSRCMPYATWMRSGSRSQSPSILREVFLVEPAAAPLHGVLEIHPVVTHQPVAFIVVHGLFFAMHDLLPVSQDSIYRLLSRLEHPRFPLGGFAETLK